MHPDFMQMTLHEQREELDRGLRAAYLTRTVTPRRRPSRRTRGTAALPVHDDAALDGSRCSTASRFRRGRHVVAEVDGVVVAAQPRRGRRVARRPVPADGAPAAAARAAREAARAGPPGAGHLG